MMDLEYPKMSGLAGLGSGLRSRERSKPDLSILTDPTLVEDFDEIMKQMPSLKKDEESLSVNASVVITPTEAHANDVNRQKVDYEGVPDLGDLQLEDEEEEEEGEEELAQDIDNEHDTSFSSRHGNELQDSDYAYSDSDFEDNLEERLRSLETSSQRNSGEHVSSVKGIVANDTSSAIDNNMVADRAKEARNGLEQRSYDDIDDDDDEAEEQDDNDEEDLNIGWNTNESDDSDELQPLNPPQELDPSKLYALYPFQGPDPSHCQLEQDEGCTLLNDQDSYWWLVKRCSDGKIGFAPAELLETFPERLARLNCWKNENISSHSISHKEDSNSSKESNILNKEDSIEAVESPLNAYSKTNKSVSFNNVVSYAERYIDEIEQEPLEDDSGELNGAGEYVHDVESRDGQDGHLHLGTDLGTHLTHVDEIHETLLNDHLSDDVSEVVSDAAFNVHEMAPLMVQKNRPSKPALTDLLSEKQNDLKQVFQAPTMPVAAPRGTSQMTNSNSNCSISTIGEYSPSSSDWTNDSPQLLSEKEFEKSNLNDQIPSSRAIQDISKIVSSQDAPDLNSLHDEDSLQHSESLPKVTHNHQHSISTLNAVDINSSVGTEKTIDIDEENSILPDENTNAYSTVPSSIASSCMDHEHNSPLISEVALHTSTGVVGDYHPVINSLYNPIFSKIDVMMDKIENAISN